MASDRGSSQKIILQPICDWLRSSRVLIASGFSPRFAIKHNPEAPEERRKSADEVCTGSNQVDVRGQSSRYVSGISGPR